MNLKRLNLNLLISLDTLLKERHVTRAAKRYGVSQAAMSAQLTQLRAMFNDELLIKVGNEMQLTERAIEIQPRLSNLIADTVSLVEDIAEFDPQHDTSEITIGLGDYGAMLFVDEIESRFAERAPHMKLKLKRLTYLDSLDEFRTQGLHLSLNYYRAPPQGLMAKKLYEETLVCIMSPHHPFANVSLTIDHLQSERVGIIYYADQHGGSNVLTKLQQQGILIEPNIMMPFFGPAILTVNQTKLIYIIPKKLAEKFKLSLGYIIQPFPIKLSSSNVSLFWQKQHTHLRWHQWMRALIFEIVSA